MSATSIVAQFGTPSSRFAQIFLRTFYRGSVRSDEPGVAAFSDLEDFPI
jgi:hypothetical protein